MRERIGPFELLAPVGRGATATVWRGRHVDYQIDVAIKLLKGHILTRQHGQATFMDEVHAIARLDHDYVVHILDAGTVERPLLVDTGAPMEAGTPYLIMELASGGTLTLCSQCSS